MATFVLIPGAGGGGWFWHLVVGELRARGHRTVAVDLPVEDDSAGLSVYSDAVVRAVPDTDDVVMVGQSMGGLTAPLVCDRVPIALLVMLNAMIPAPGETGAQWWLATEQAPASRANARRLGLDPAVLDDQRGLFGHDVPAELFAEAGRRLRVQSGTPFAEPWPLAAWPSVPTRVIAAREDRLFPVEFQRRVARDRLGLDVDTVPGGHLAILSRPVEVAQQLDDYARELVVG